MPMRYDYPGDDGPRGLPIDSDWEYQRRLKLHQEAMAHTWSAMGLAMKVAVVRWLERARAIDQRAHAERDITVLSMEREYRALPPTKKFIAKWSAFFIPAWVGLVVWAYEAFR